MSRGEIAAPASRQGAPSPRTGTADDPRGPLAKRSRPLAVASLVGLLATMMLAACPPPAATHRGEAASRGEPSKEALFGDPSLVPTRAGEQARVEIALARTIEEHLAEDPQIAGVRAHVTTADATGEGHAQVLISFQGPQAGAEAQEERARAVALGILGDPGAQVTIDRIEAPRGAQEPSPAQARPLSLVLVIALLALGASAGISVDRLRRRRSRG